MNSQTHLKTTFIVGAGAVENAWDPIIKALQPYHDFPLTPDGANSFLARLVYLLRWWAADHSELGKSELKKHKVFISEIRNALCKALKKAEARKQIRVRPEFQDIVNKMILPYGREFMLVTTNWDNVVGLALSSLLNSKFTKVKVNPLHIHGNFKAPNTLYLPTEMTKEPYRSKSEELLIGGIHGAIWRGMENSHRAVIYGLSISPLDAELSQILASGWSNNCLSEIDIIAPDHKQIAERVNLLLDRKRDVIVKGYEPKRLDISTDYTIRRYLGKPA